MNFYRRRDSKPRRRIGNHLQSSVPFWTSIGTSSNDVRARHFKVEACADLSGVLTLDGDQSGDPHDEIVRLEERIEELAAKIESCRKFILALRIAVAGGALVLAAMLFSVIRYDPSMLTAAVAALLGGIAVWGSNGSTAKEATNELALAESDRSALIEKLDLGDVTPLRGFSAGSQDGTTA
jgi:hypothetical protein